MVTNIDGTGYTFQKEGDDKETPSEDSKIEELEEFFQETYPGQSFVTIRKNLRRDIERTGNGYIGDHAQPAGRNHLHPPRGREDDAHPAASTSRSVAEKTVWRGGKEVTIKTLMRERRYASSQPEPADLLQRVRLLARPDKKTAHVGSDPGQRLPWKLRATEMIHFIALPDGHDAVWRAALDRPIAVGDRLPQGRGVQLEFFDNGGVPPILILLQGGVLTTATRRRSRRR